jgi:hypothetical protein
MHQEWYTRGPPSQPLAQALADILMEISFNTIPQTLAFDTLGLDVSNP